jgi:hypothetical protein
MGTASLKARLNRLIQSTANRPCPVCVRWMRSGIVFLNEGDPVPPSKCPACGRAVVVKLYMGFDYDAV